MLWNKDKLDTKVEGFLFEKDFQMINILLWLNHFYMKY